MLAYAIAGADLFQAYNGFVRGPCAGLDFAETLLHDFRQSNHAWNNAFPERKTRLSSVVGAED